MCISYAYPPDSATYCLHSTLTGVGGTFKLDFNLLLCVVVHINFTGVVTGNRFPFSLVGFTQREIRA